MPERTTIARRDTTRAMSDDATPSDEPRPRTFKWRMIGGAIGASLGAVAGAIGGVAAIDVLCWGVAPGFVVGFVGEPLIELYFEAGGRA
ncbi:MAG: hypothetical protein R3F29_00820 [Planctomycetota bacterium]